MVNLSGLVVIAFGVWVCTQVFRGQALQRLRIVS